MLTKVLAIETFDGVSINGTANFLLSHHQSQPTLVFNMGSENQEGGCACA
jgi:hypothetical protein